MIHMTWEGLSHSVSLFLPFFCLYPAFPSPLFRVQLYGADQEGVGMQKEVALIVTGRIEWVSWECGGP